MGFARRSIHPAISCLTGCLTGPTGKSPISLSSLFCKNISVFKYPKSLLELLPSHPTRGALAIVTNAGWVAVDAGSVRRVDCEAQGGLLSVSGLRHARRRRCFADGEVVWS